jgi:hypothetical protein
MRRCEGRRRAWGALVLLVVIAAPALANTRSQQLLAKALIPFQAQRWAQAQVLPIGGRRRSERRDRRMLSAWPVRQAFATRPRRSGARSCAPICSRPC